MNLVFRLAQIITRLSKGQQSQKSLITTSIGPHQVNLKNQAIPSETSSETSSKTSSETESSCLSDTNQSFIETSNVNSHQINNCERYDNSLNTAYIGGSENYFNETANMGGSGDDNIKHKSH